MMIDVYVKSLEFSIAKLLIRLNLACVLMMISSMTLMLARAEVVEKDCGEARREDGDTIRR